MVFSNIGLRQSKATSGVARILFVLRQRLRSKYQPRIQARMNTKSVGNCYTVESCYSEPLECGHCFNGWFAQVQTAFSLTAINYCRHPPFHKADRFFSPTSTWTVQNSQDNADTGRPLMQDCLAPLIDSTTGH